MQQGSDRPRSFGSARRGEPQPKDEFPERVIIPAMVLKPVELPVVLTVDQETISTAVQMVKAAFKQAAMEALQESIVEWEQALAEQTGAQPAGPGRPDESGGQAAAPVAG